MNRREFIIDTCGTCLAMAGLSTSFSSCSATHYLTGTLGKDGLTIDKEAFREKSKTAYRSFIIVRNEALQYPICVYRFGEDNYAALWMRCTHQGTELQASGNFLQCPAHGSEFNNHGRVTNGPADKDLRTFPVTIDDNQLFIDLRAK
ncbi:QcrA and Rieske domain-containing protein [Chitinophaga japonensis]|uniref:Rieske-like 2Fe-2S protein n=1 Tax=Chitinophaga japonensis TaxID=104662 RepID=A0A562SMW7_CHIJA|nr:Rieske (2Fe-2S) protein [Chitinophaga japonensis]TWI82637.1 Rieske-like 2Fe-2S protein [Chitinophaga japonensis]